MAKKLSKKVKKSLAANTPVNLSAAGDAIEKPARNGQEAGLNEALATESQAVQPSTKPTPAEAPPKQSEPPQSPEKAAAVAQASKPTATKTIEVTFVLCEPDAKQVALCGDFNGWAAGATPMKRRDDGHWETTVALMPGRHQYKFVVDGHWIPDLLAHENVWNHHGTLNSVIEVRPYSLKIESE
jgi:hypothetical protein